MKQAEIDDVKKILKDSLPLAPEVELQRDLWPETLRRLDQQNLQVPWWDWALLAGVTVSLCVFPGLVLALLYHL